MWVLVALASLVVLIILLSCIPLDMMVHVEVSGRPRFRMRLGWLFGLVDKEIKRGKKKPEEKKEPVAGGRKRRMRINIRTMVKILRIKGLLRQFLDLLRAVLGRLRIRNLRANFRIGLDNPADTGFLFILLRPAAFFLNSLLPCRITVQPSFSGEASFEGYLYGMVRLHPIQMVRPFVRFIFSLPTMRVIKLAVLRKWRRKS